MRSGFSVEAENKARASLVARELITDGVTIHPGEKISYVIVDAKAKNKAERISTSNRSGVADYDRKEYAARLEVATQEIGVFVRASLLLCGRETQLVLPGLKFY